MVRQLGTFVVPDESSFYGIPRDFYKYGESRLARALIRSIVPECIRAESLPEVIMLRFVSKSGEERKVHPQLNFHRIKNSVAKLLARNRNYRNYRLSMVYECLPNRRDSRSLAGSVTLSFARKCLLTMIFASRRLIYFVRFNGYLYSPTCAALKFSNLNKKRFPLTTITCRSCSLLSSVWRGPRQRRRPNHSPSFPS